MQEESPPAHRTVTAGRYTLRRDGQKILLNDGRDGRIDTGSVPAAKGFLRFAAAREPREGEGIQAYLTRVLEDYRAAVWVRLGRGRR